MQFRPVVSVLHSLRFAVLDHFVSVIRDSSHVCSDAVLNTWMALDCLVVVYDLKGCASEVTCVDGKKELSPAADVPLRCGGSKCAPRVSTGWRL